jgi:hypothetical protein
VGVELFIYWKVAATLLPQALAAAQALQQALRLRHPALQARLLQRADEAGVATLMEVYSHLGGVGTALRQDIEQQAAAHLAPLGPAAGARHVEVFEAR